MSQAPHHQHDASCQLYRLDQYLVRRELASSRVKAQRLIEQGLVSVNGRRAQKSSMQVCQVDALEVALHETYVSRGAYKLLGAFEQFAHLGLADPVGKRCLDIGASTGGFTQVLLERGAAEVIALDVGHDQLDQTLVKDPRVLVMSGVNIREVGVEDLPYRPSVIVSDVSFISLTYVLPIIADVAADGADIVTLIKPQFEVGREHLHRGIVNDPAMVDWAVERICQAAREAGLQVVGCANSPITGLNGNTEVMMYARRSQMPVIPRGR